MTRECVFRYCLDICGLVHWKAPALVRPWLRSPKTGETCSVATKNNRNLLLQTREKRSLCTVSCRWRASKWWWEVICASVTGRTCSLLIRLPHTFLPSRICRFVMLERLLKYRIA